MRLYLFIPLLAVTFFVSCQNNQHKGKNVAQKGAESPTNIKNEKLSISNSKLYTPQIGEKSVNLKDLPEFSESTLNKLEIIEQKKIKDEELLNPISILSIASTKEWYFTQSDLKSTSNLVLSKTFETLTSGKSLIASIQSIDQVIIDKNYYDSLNAEQKQKFLLKEILTSAYLVKFIKLNNICNLLNTKHGSEDTVFCTEKNLSVGFTGLSEAEFRSLGKTDLENIQKASHIVEAITDKTLLSDFYNQMTSLKFDSRIFNLRFISLDKSALSLSTQEISENIKNSIKSNNLNCGVIQPNEIDNQTTLSKCFAKHSEVNYQNSLTKSYDQIQIYKDSENNLFTFKIPVMNNIVNSNINPVTFEGESAKLSFYFQINKIEKLTNYSSKASIIAMLFDKSKLLAIMNFPYQIIERVKNEDTQLELCRLNSTQEEIVLLSTGKNLSEHINLNEILNVYNKEIRQMICGKFLVDKSKVNTDKNNQKGEKSTKNGHELTKIPNRLLDKKNNSDIKNRKSIEQDRAPQELEIESESAE